ncbi:MAG: hypothetical protein ABSH42_06465 [Bryobacteraceae bacterium]|jgi:hypothetical protein
MAGQIKSLIDTIIEKRSQGSSVLMLTTRAKFYLKGVDPDRYDRLSSDDPAVIARIKEIGAELGVTL